MKIGIFGGSFNPVHKMHMNIAEKLIAEKEVDRLIFVPTGDGYEKSNLESFSDRKNMLIFAIENSNKENIDVSDVEENEDIMYTYQTLDYFKNKYPSGEIIFIMGADNLDEFEIWKEHRYMLANYKFLVIKRDSDKKDINKILEKYQHYKDSIRVSKIREENISSTHVRKLIKENEIDKLKTLVDSKVLEYIKDNNLYQENKKS